MKTIIEQMRKADQKKLVESVAWVAVLAFALLVGGVTYFYHFVSVHATN